jgi:hypothetical protein
VGERQNVLAVDGSIECAIRTDEDPSGHGIRGQLDLANDRDMCLLAGIVFADHLPQLGRCLDKALRLLAKQRSEGLLRGHQVLEQVEGHRQLSQSIIGTSVGYPIPVSVAQRAAHFPILRDAGLWPILRGRRRPGDPQERTMSHQPPKQSKKKPQHTPKEKKTLKQQKKHTSDAAPFIKH